MILTITAKKWEQLPDGRLQITANCENLKEALGEHSPNILIDYLNENWHTRISRIAYRRKEAKNGNI